MGSSSSKKAEENNNQFEEVKSLEEEEESISNENLKDSKVLKEKSLSSVCEIQVNKGKGTGFFCSLKYPDKFSKMHCLITNYNIVNEEVVNGNDYLNIILNNQQIQINLDYKRKIWFNEMLDFTCLEIVKEDNLIERLNTFNVNDDCYNKKINNKKYDNKHIKITSVNYNSEVEIFHGNILYIDNNNSAFYHNCKINPELFCGPILLSNNFSIIGIHIVTKEEKNIGLYFSEIFKNLREDNYIEKVVPDRSRNEFICEINIEKDNFKGNIVLFKCNEENTNYFDIDKIEVIKQDEMDAKYKEIINSYNIIITFSDVNNIDKLYVD
jgi:hypothetical protein